MWHWMVVESVRVRLRSIITGVIGVPASRCLVAVTRIGIATPGGGPVICLTSCVCTTRSPHKRPGNGCDLVSPPRRAHYEFKSLTKEQAQRLLTAFHGHNMEALFVLALTTGMRRGEILALKWQDIDFVQNTLQVRRIFTRSKGQRYVLAEPKTDKSRRSLVLPTLVVDLLKQHRANQQEAKLEEEKAYAPSRSHYRGSDDVSPIVYGSHLEQIDDLAHRYEAFSGTPNSRLSPCAMPTTAWRGTGATSIRYSTEPAGRP